MELGKHERETSTKGTLWKEKLKQPTENGEPSETTAVKESSSLKFLYREQVPSESGFLRFTFVPSFGRLPSQCLVIDATSLLVRVSEFPLEKTNQDIKNTTEAVAEGQGVKSGAKPNSEAFGCTRTIHKHLQPRDCNTSKRKMDKDDLFQADFVFVVDSDEDKMPVADHGYGHARPHILGTSRMSTSSESRGNVSQQPHRELPHSSAGLQKQSQFSSPLSTSGQLAHKSLSPTNLKVEPGLAPTPHQASSVQESHSQWQSADGSTIQKSSTYLQSIASYSVPFSMLKRPPFPFNSLSDSVQSPHSLQASNLHKTPESTMSPLPSKDLPPSSPISSSSDALQSLSPHTLSPPPPKRFNTLASVPVYITTHLLSPSPKPLSSPFHGSSSTICSVNNPCSQMSSRGKPGIRSPLPTRLSLLTAILKSGSSPKRPFSPASCPATFSPNSLGSSTLTIDPKFRTTPPTPKKLASNYSVRSDSPGQDEYLLSVFSNEPNHMTLSSKSTPTLRAGSVSPKRYLDAGELSPDKLRPLSPTISSYKKAVVLPLLQPMIPNSSLPPHVPRNTSRITAKGGHSPTHRYRGPEKSKRVHTYSPTFTAKSYPLSIPDSNQQDMFDPTSEKYSSLSPVVLQPSCRSKAFFPKVSAKDLNGHSPVSAQCRPFSPEGSTSPVSPDSSVSPPSVRMSSSSIHESYRACPSSSRRRTPLMQSSSPTRVQSPCSLLSRSRELTSPLPADSKASQPHKIKASYKAFAAIPTNTLLLEQKALDEPEGEESTSETHSEICSPAQMRQQTEELCAAIDEVLQDPLSMHPRDSSPGSLKNLLALDTSKTSTALQRPGGRETRFANLNLLTPTLNESKKTRPGVIRPTTVTPKIISMKEEPVQPNPFKKYLEETTESQSEKVSALSCPFLNTKLNFPTKSLLHPQVISQADFLTPGPFSHLGPVFGDTFDNSYRPYRHNALYNKPTHPIVPIPENAALSSKELHSARVQCKTSLPPHHENKEQSRGSFVDNALPHSRAGCLLRGDAGDFPAQSN